MFVCVKEYPKNETTLSFLTNVSPKDSIKLQRGCYNENNSTVDQKIKIFENHSQYPRTSLMQSHHTGEQITPTWPEITLTQSSNFQKNQSHSPLNGDENNDFDKNFRKAIDQIKHQRFEAAISIFESSLQIAIEKYGKEAENLAIHHYNLGAALLSKVVHQKAMPQGIQKNERHLVHPEGMKTGISVQTADSAFTTPDKQSPLITLEVPHKTDETVPLQVLSTPENNKEKLSDIQAAWENLELARVYTEKKLERLNQEMNIDEISKTMRYLATVHLKLGTCNCLQENYSKAISDYESGLNLLKFSEDRFYSRDIAEAFYLIGQAHLFINTKECDDIAIVHLQKSRIILENIIYRELNLYGKKDPENVEDQISVLRKDFFTPSLFEKPEIKELKVVLLEIYSKIEDAWYQRDKRAQLNAEKDGNKTNKMHEEKTSAAGEDNWFKKLGFKKQSLGALDLAPNNHDSLTSTNPSTHHQTLFPTVNRKEGEPANSLQVQQPQKFVQLGLFSSFAKKREREESGSSSKTKGNEKAHPLKDPKKNFLLYFRDEGKKEDNHVTKLDDSGKPEKMTKPT